MIVGIKESPPFIYRNESGGTGGISVWLWEQLAEELGYAYRYREMSLRRSFPAWKREY
ncbi:MAG: transporter substrate-binding domain-containing protein [Lewinellaceae bacterium]|nr:transporter substrate-binding domain-containing protein [Lewinellaceae bacterium]